MAAPTFLMIGNGPYSNRGCEAIVRGTVDILSERFHSARYVLSSFGGQYAIGDARNESDRRIVHVPHKDCWFRRFGIDWWRFRVLHRHSDLWQKGAYFRSQFFQAKAASVVLQIGGDNYSMEYGFPERFVELDRIVTMLGKPLVLWAASIGASPNASDNTRLASHLRNFDLVLARESKTFDFLRSLGLAEKVKLVADPAFLLAPQSVKLPQPVEALLETRPIGVNFSPLAGSLSGQSHEQWIENVSKSVAGIAEMGYGIVLVPHVTVADGDDYSFLAEVANKLGESGYKNVEVLPAALSAAQYKYVISRLRLFVGARTHSTIAAMSSGVPTISVGYSAKSEGINMDVFGSLDWLIRADHLVRGELVERVETAIKNEDNIRQLLDTALPIMVKRARDAADFVCNLLSVSR